MQTRGWIPRQKYLHTPIWSSWCLILKGAKGQGGLIHERFTPCQTHRHKSKTPTTVFFPVPDWNAVIQTNRNILGKSRWFHRAVATIKGLSKVTAFLSDMKWSIADNAMYFFILKKFKGPLRLPHCTKDLIHRKPFFSPNCLEQQVKQTIRYSHRSTQKHISHAHAQAIYALTLQK